MPSTEVMTTSKLSVASNTFPLAGEMEISESNVLNKSETSVSIQLRAERIAIMAVVTHATTNIEMPEMTLMMLRDFLEKRYLRDMNSEMFTGCE